MTLPNAPQGLAATPSTGGGQAIVALSWTANPPSDGVVEYLIFRTPAAYFMPELVAAIVGTACTDSAGELLPNTKWYYFVVAVNAAGTSPVAATAGIAIPLPLPSAPTGLVAAANGNDTVSLSWNANPAGQDVTGYNLYREASGSSSATLLATVSGTSYTDTGSALTAGSRWTYYLTAVNAAGTSPASATASVAIPLPLPSAPTGLVATANGNDTVSLSWNANPTGQDVTGYDVYREASGSSSATLLATASGTSYTDGDSALTAGSSWTYYLKAVNATGTSPASAPASVTIPESAGGTLIATFAVNNYGTVPVANPQISFAQPFAPGDVPSACIIQLRKSDGVTVIPSQQDQESTWLQDGSWKTVAISSVSPDTFAAGETITYQLWSVPGSPNRTPNVTLAQLTANSDIKLLFTGYDLGTDTWEISVNDIVANGRGAVWAPTNGPGWGANPTRGWEVIRSGPVCTEWRFWSVLRRLSDGAWHPFLRGVIYVRAWGAHGPYEVCGYWSEPNVWGDNSGNESARITTTQFTATLQNGSAVLMYYGGSDDFRVTQVDASAAIVNGRIQLTRQQHYALLGVASADFGYNSGCTTAFGGGVPVVFSSTGSLPGGISAGTVYYVGSTPGASYQLSVCGNVMDSADNSNNPISLSPGSGTLTIAPIAQCLPYSCGCVFDKNCRRVWINGTRPTLLVGHDFTYLTTKSRAMPPFISTVTVDGTIAPAAASFCQTAWYWPANPGGGGDSTINDRYGYMSWHNACELYRPFDNNLHQTNLAIAASFPNTGQFALDEKAATYVVCDETQYPGMAAPVGPNVRLWFNNVNTGFGNLTIGSGFAGDIAGDHQGMMYFMPYLKTGDHFWYEMLANFMGTRIPYEANTLYHNPATGVTAYKAWAYYDAPTYYNGLNPSDADFGSGLQVRGVGHMVRWYGITVHFMPATRPEASYFRNQLHGNLAVINDFANRHGANYLGCYMASQSGAYTGDYYMAPFFLDFMYHLVAMEAWRNEYPEALEYITSFAYKWCPGRTDTSNPTNPGCVWPINAYQTPIADVNGNWYTTWDQAYRNLFKEGFFVATSAIVTFAAGSDQMTAVVSGGGSGNVSNNQNLVNTIAGDFAGTPMITGGASGNVGQGSTVALGPYFGTTTPTTAKTNGTTYTATAAGGSSGTTLRMQSVPAGVMVGMGVYDQTNPAALPMADGGSAATCAYITAINGNTITLSTPMMAAVNSGDTILFGPLAIFSGSVMIPYLGAATLNSTFPFTELICPIANEIQYPGPASYVTMHTMSLAMADVLYGMTGNPKLATHDGQRPQVAYNEIRRRQGLTILSDGKTAAPYGPLSFNNAPKYAIGPIGATQ